MDVHRRQAKIPQSVKISTGEPMKPHKQHQNLHLIQLLRFRAEKSGRGDSELRSQPFGALGAHCLSQMKNKGLEFTIAFSNKQEVNRTSKKVVQLSDFGRTPKSGFKNLLISTDPFKSSQRTPDLSPIE
ncbi:Uncharacterized protein Fot_31730 [Forsythia ovata]|uniref:Uncharacterized protein n=1 Tax=Forsythia ovata TaxID=205694 RepID=A0ABD1T6C9_9LAMI